MRKRGQMLPELSPAQQEIMERVWKHGELSVSGVRALLTQNRQVARNTVRTLLERMEQKGWLKHREEGRTFFYCAARPKQTSIGEKLSDVVDRLCGGSTETLIAALINFRGVTRGELKRIRQMLDEAQSPTVAPREK